MARRGLVSAAAALVVGLAVAGCGSAANDDSAAPSPAAPQDQSSPTDQASATAPAPATTDTAATGSADFGDGVDQLRDGTWQVGDAGEVEFTIQGGHVTLTEVRPAEGWQHRVDTDDDELEVHFTKGSVEWKFEVDVDDDDNDVEISKDLKIRQAAAGDYAVGTAGVVSFSQAGSSLTLGAVTPNAGWRVTDQEADSDEIEVDFRDSAGGEAEFEVDFQGGGLEVEIRQKRSGPLLS